MKVANVFRKTNITRVWHMLSQHKKSILLAALAVLSAVSILSVGPSYAYLKLEALPAENSFSLAPAALPKISETFANGATTKSDVTINVGDTGGYSVYVRAVAVVTWKDASGNVLGTPPRSGTDYSIRFGSGWTQDSDGYYYYSDPVVSSGSTGEFITSCSVNGPAPEEGYSLSVEILAQTIQSEGKTSQGDSAAKDAWGHSFA